MFAEILSECRELATEARDEVKKVREAPERERSAMSASIFGLLKKADENLESLQRHTKHAGADEKAQLKREEETLRSELREVAGELERARKDLLLNDGNTGSTEKLFLATEERRRAGAVTKSLEKSTSRLKEATKTSLQTETIGMETLMELRKQREQLHGVNDRVTDMGTNMKDANKSLDELEKPACVLM